MREVGDARAEDGGRWLDQLCDHDAVISNWAAKEVVANTAAVKRAAVNKTVVNQVAAKRVAAKKSAAKESTAKEALAKQLNIVILLKVNR